MLERRVIVTLLLDQGRLVKTTRFQKPRYVGDPLNAVRIFNEYEVDELIFLDIGASKGSPIRFDLLQMIADQCFMPVTYGGGLTSLEAMHRVFQIGFEKVALNTGALRNPELVAQASRRFGRQSIVASVDYRRDWLGRYQLVAAGQRLVRDPLDWCMQLEQLGAGELLVNCVDRDGTWNGYDLAGLKRLRQRVSIPLIALGGASSVEDLGRAISESGVDAAAAGSLFVFQKKGMGVLLHYPDSATLTPIRLQQTGRTL